MHEASITKSILDTVLGIITEKNVKETVIAVHVTVGVCQGMVPESMQMFFDMEKPGTPLENAELVVTGPIDFQPLHFGVGVSPDDYPIDGSGADTGPGARRAVVALAGGHRQLHVV